MGCRAGEANDEEGRVVMDEVEVAVGGEVGAGVWGEGGEEGDGAGGDG